MAEDTPLTALCAICHIGALKYTCPRCSIHTCSLPCVKLHKARASCSGVRDPATYRKRADLATTSSIDSDFNFITSLERSLSRTEEGDHSGGGDGGAENGDQLLQAAGTGLGRTRQTDSARLERLVKERGVIWRRAPRGMRRRQENGTRIEHSGVTWTAEFVFADGSRRMCAASDTSEVGQVLERAVNPLPSKNLGKRKRELGRQGRHEQAKGRQKPDSTHGETPNGHEKARLLEEEIQAAEQIANPSPATADAPAKVPLELYEDKHIYIHRPNTPSKFKVLAPLQRSDTLLCILEGRTVMEFPTFYIKAEPPDALPTPFMTEERYLREYGEDVVPLAAEAGLGSGVDGESPEVAEDGGEDGGEEGEIMDDQQDLKRDAEEVLRALADPSKVMSVLKQDLIS